MSNELIVTESDEAFNPATLSSFSGGTSGQCLQLTQQGSGMFNNVCLDIGQVQDIMRTMQMWLDQDTDRHSREAERNCNCHKVLMRDGDAQPHTFACEADHN